MMRRLILLAAAACFGIAVAGALPSVGALDAALEKGRNAELMAQSFRVVKVDVGNFNRNLDIAAEYAGELADARRMSESGIYEFFKRVADTAQPKS